MIAPMIACHRPYSPDIRTSSALALGLILLSAPAMAADPATTPTDPAPFDAPLAAPADVTATPAESGAAAAFDPEFDASLPEIPLAPVLPAVAGATGPDYQPPRVDGYLDLAFADSDFSNYGYSETPGGYRLIVGFRLEEVSNQRWLVAPEFGYFRIGKALTETTTVTRNDIHQGYDTTRTDSASLDATSLDLGCRVDRILTPRFSAFVRGGLSFYHLARNEDAVLSYAANIPATEDGEFDGVTESPLSDSSSASGLGAFGSLGLTVRLGEVPALYAEYSMRQMDNEILASTSLGVTLNF